MRWRIGRRDRAWSAYLSHLAPYRAARMSPAHRALDRRSARQHGLVTRPQLRRCGFTERQIDDLVDPRRAPTGPSAASTRLGGCTGSRGTRRCLPAVLGAGEGGSGVALRRRPGCGTSAYCAGRRLRAHGASHLSGRRSTGVHGPPRRCVLGRERRRRIATASRARPSSERCATRRHSCRGSSSVACSTTGCDARSRPLAAHPGRAVARLDSGPHRRLSRRPGPPRATRHRLRSRAGATPSCGCSDVLDGGGIATAGATVRGAVGATDLLPRLRVARLHGLHRVVRALVALGTPSAVAYDSDPPHRAVGCRMAAAHLHRLSRPTRRSCDRMPPSVLADRPPRGHEPPI